MVVVVVVVEEEEEEVVVVVVGPKLDVDASISAQCYGWSCHERGVALPGMHIVSVGRYHGWTSV